jgi:hypothetical protein
MKIPRSFVVLAAVACSLFSVRAADSKLNSGWRTIPLVKNGKVSSDWVHIGYGGFSTEGDAIRTDCDPRGLGLLVYKKERLGNCQVRVVFKVKDKNSNSGVYVRLRDSILAQAGKPGDAFDRDANNKISDESMKKVQAAAEREEGAWHAVHNGYEVQIAGGGDELHRTGAIYSLAPSKGVSAKQPGEWQTMVITLDGTRISVELDGQSVSSLDTASKDLPPRKQWHEPKREPKRPEVGYIGLQNHDPGDIVWFKEVSVRPLAKR